MAPAQASPAVPAATGSRWRDLGVRVASAAILAPIVLLALWLGGTAWNVLIALLTVGLLMEMFGLYRHRPASTIGTPARTALALVYILPTSLALIWLRADAQTGFADVLFLMLVIWASDIGAYVFGRMFGGPRLAPSISPGKTWSGAAAGLLCALAVGAIAAMTQPGAGAVMHAALVAGLLGLIAQAGDLLESALKRHYGVKDTGHLIPGHGGLLDRLDAVLTAAPAAALLAWLTADGVSLWQ